MHVVAILLKTNPKESCSFCEPMSFKILHQSFHQIVPIKAMYLVPGLIALNVCEILQVNLKNNIYDKSIISSAIVTNLKLKYLLRPVYFDFRINSFFMPSLCHFKH